MKIIIAGSRPKEPEPIAMLDIFHAVCHSPFYNKITEIVSGHAYGADRLGEAYAKIDKIKLTIFRAKWDQFGKYAGYYRNQEMAKYADGLIAVWDEKSRGTKNMIDTMLGLEKPVFIWKYLDKGMR